MKKTIIFSLLFAVCLFFIFNSEALASDATKIYNYFSGNFGFRNPATSIKGFSSNIFSILQAIGIMCAVCLSVYMGIQWMIATPTKKAELKGRMIYYLLGVVLLLTVPTVLNVLSKIASEIGDSL